MLWKDELKKLEHAHLWDEAIEFIKKVLDQDPNNMDAYIFMNYLLMNLLIEEDYDKSKEKYYIDLCKKYFDESYGKFSDNAEFLYLTARTAVMCELFYGISVSDYEKMIEKAARLDPKNPLYQKDFYYKLSKDKPTDRALLEYAHMILSKDSPLQKQLETKGAIGEYLLMLKENWAKRILENALDIKRQ